MIFESVTVVNSSVKPPPPSDHLPRVALLLIVLSVIVPVPRCRTRRRLHWCLRGVAADRTMCERDVIAGEDPTAVSTQAHRAVGADRTVGDRDRAGDVEPAAARKIARCTVAADRAVRDRSSAVDEEAAAVGILTRGAVSADRAAGDRQHRL